MTDKQKRFCDEYLVDANATQAAIRAGYSKKSARQIADETLSKPYVREYIDQLLEALAAERIATAQEVIEYLTFVMRRQATENVVVTLKEEESIYVPDDNGALRKKTIKREVPKIVQIPARLCDSNKAAELLGKRYGLFADKVELSGSVNANNEKLDNLIDELWGDNSE